MRPLSVSVCVVGVTLVLGPAATLAAQGTPPATPPSAAGPPPLPPSPCPTDPQRRQFDFWLGTWDVHPWAAPGASGPKLGVNVVTAILEDCAILESWTSAGGGSGRSFNWFDRNTRRWRQLWLDRSGGTLDYTDGEFRDGAMRFRGWTRAPDGSRVEQRLSFFAIHPDTVRQLFETSTDGGQTWTPGFDGRYIRRRP